MNQVRSRKINGLPALLFWMAIWHIAAAALDNGLLLPGPVQVLKCLGGLAVTKAFWETVAVSIARILVGVTLAVALGVVLAVLTFLSRLLETLIAPALTAMQATPVASFTILVLIWVERDWVPVLICGMMVLPVVYSSVSAGIHTVDAQLLEMAKVYRLSEAVTWKRIWIPSVRPFFRSACVSALGLGWKAGIAAEVLTVPKQSIGRMLSEGKLYMMTEDMFAWTVTVVALSLLLQKLMLQLLGGGKADA